MDCLFSKITPFEDNVSTILSPIEAAGVKYSVQYTVQYNVCPYNYRSMPAKWIAIVRNYAVSGTIFIWLHFEVVLCSHKIL